MVDKFMLLPGPWHRGLSMEETLRNSTHTTFRKGDSFPKQETLFSLIASPHRRVRNAS